MSDDTRDMPYIKVPKEAMTWTERREMLERLRKAGAVDPEPPKPVWRMKCSCEWTVLHNRGCQCGGW